MLLPTHTLLCGLSHLKLLRTGSPFKGRQNRVSIYPETLPDRLASMLPPISDEVKIILKVVSILSVSLVFFRVQRPSLPPGPFSIPFLGSPFSVPKSNFHVWYSKWLHTYGPISYFGVFGRHFIVLNTPEVIEDLFEVRSKIYCSRPRMVMAGDLVGRDKSMLFLPYGERFKETQRLLHVFLKQSTLSKHWPLQEQATRGLLSKFLSSPDDFEKHIRTSVSAAIVRLVYGHQIRNHNDILVTLAESLGSLTDTASEPGRWLVDSFPALRFVPTWFPGASFKRWAAAAHLQCEQFTRMPYEQVKLSLAEGTGLPSFTKDLLEESSGTLSAEAEDLMMYASASLYIGGTNTVISPVILFVLMMCRNPDIQRTAQREIDSLLGEDNTPRMEDVSMLPFVECIMKEIFRFSPPAPLLIHSPIQDDVYKGFLIPKGSVVIANIWGMTRNLYVEPEVFNPDRFLGSSPERDPSDYIFGYGRRACPGDEFTRSTLLLTFTQILWAFDISPALDPLGNPVIPAVEFTGGYIRQPAPFKCSIKPRSSEKAEIIQNMEDTGE
ncbi:cytochrome P450 [Mycena rebaudengoi]|nr:cytochrome P450 [Mycena rebaudengoi]